MRILSGFRESKLCPVLQLEMVNCRIVQATEFIYRCIKRMCPCHCEFAFDLTIIR